MSSITTTSAEQVPTSGTDTAAAVDVASVTSMLEELKGIGIELRDSNGEPVAITEENAAEIAEAIKALIDQQADTNQSDATSDGTGDDEELPPFELPAMYRDATNRESLSETSAYADHLNEHWGF